MGLGPLDGLLRAPEKVAERAQRGPREAVLAMDFGSMTPRQRTEWLDGARLAAVLGPCAKTLPSVRSGIRCYIEFASMLVIRLCEILNNLCASRASHGSQCRRRRCSILPAEARCSYSVVNMFSEPRDIQELQGLC